MNSTLFLSSRSVTFISNCLLVAPKRVNYTSNMSSILKYNTGFKMNIKDCFNRYSQPGWAFTLHFKQGCPALDLKLLPGCTKVIPEVVCSRSTNTWNNGPEYSAFNSFSLGSFSMASGFNLVRIYTSTSFLTCTTMYRYTVCPWYIGLSLLSCNTIHTCASLAIGRMKPFVMFR